MEAYLGIDVGSVTTKLAVINEADELVADLYWLTRGKPIETTQQGLRQIKEQLPPGMDICGVATTGSARYLTGVIVGADLVKNEITSHAEAAMFYFPGVQTVIEIGGQDSKIIIIRDGMVADFGMNTVCAAGTGSFLDHQAQRLKMSIDQFGRRALDSRNPAHIAGRCTVFAESDMIHQQQTGHSTSDILYGLCQALVRNYLSNVGSGKEIKPPIVFQGGVAFNQGIVMALGEALESDIIVPPHHEVMGAIGAALLVHEEIAIGNIESKFKGFGVSRLDYHASSFQCQACPSQCEIARISVYDELLACWGGHCDLWETSPTRQELRTG